MIREGGPRVLKEKKERRDRFIDKEEGRQCKQIRERVSYCSSVFSCSSYEEKKMF